MPLPTQQLNKYKINKFRPHQFENNIKKDNCPLNNI